MRRAAKNRGHAGHRSAAGLAILLVAATPLVLSAAPEPAATPAATVVSGVRVRTARIERDPQATPPGIVTLEVGTPSTALPPDTIQIDAILHGPLPEKSGSDIYALNAVLNFPPAHLEFVAGTLRKGEFLGRDGRDVLITGRVFPESDGALTIGSSRLGPIPGVTSPPGASRLFSAAFRVRQGGTIPLRWSEATFIDSQVRAVDAARFVGGTLSVEVEPSGPPPEANPGK